MASYLILTPPGGPDRNHENTRFIRDGFSLPAFLFPTLWMLYHRLWLLAAAVFLLQGVGLELTRRPGLWPAGIALIIGVRLLAALEGRQAFFRRLVWSGWTEEALVSARRLGEAEEIYFSAIEPDAETAIPSPNWNIPSAPIMNSGRNGSSFGLPGYDGGR